MLENFFARMRSPLSAIILVLAMSLGAGGSVHAQEVEETWAMPENLSRSGYTSDPSMVLASNGVLHAVWKDQFKGTVYASLVDGAWTAPQVVALPWGSSFTPESENGLTGIFDPQLVADTAGRIHAFWIGEEDDLYYSLTFSDQFASGFSFTTPIADEVIGFQAAVDADGTARVAYVTLVDTAELPAGVYLQTRNNVSGIWSPPVRLYASQYLRGLEKGDVAVDMLIVEQGLEGRGVYVTWDNRPRKQFFMTFSTNNGITFGEPLLIAGPDGVLDTNVPNGIGMTYTSNQILLIWKEAEEFIETNCAQFYQLFGLDGAPASSPEVMFKELGGCPLGRQHLLNNGASTVLQTYIFGEPYLVAWNGDDWSIPQAQNPLGNFSDPGTYQSLQLACLSPLLTAENRVLLIGCDSGPGKDIWFTSRSIDGLSEWFTRSADWLDAVPLSQTEGTIAPIVTLADGKDNLHAIWAESPSIFDSLKNIYYARWDGTAWNFNQIIIQPPFGSVNELDGAIDLNTNTIYLVWSGGERGELYFSHANAEFAGSPTEWSAPVQLPMPRPVGSGADVQVTGSGEIIVAYSVPVNERRGVYITRSIDAGRMWSTPTSILDGISFGWEVVGPPRLVVRADGSMHLLGLRLPPSQEGETTKLYYSRSTDNGLTWLPPLEIVSGNVVEASVGVLLERTVYRYWQEASSGVVTNYLQISTDNGDTWSDAMNFIGMDSLTPTSGLVTDIAGQLHLIQVAEGVTNQLLMQEWVWDGTSWKAETLVEIDTGGLSAGSALGVGIRSGGQMGVLFSKRLDASAASQSELIFSERILDVTAPELPPLEPTATPSATPEPVVPTETPAVEATPTVLVDPGAAEPGNNNLVLQLLFGFVSAILVVLIAFMLINRFMRRR